MAHVGAMYVGGHVLWVYVVEGYVCANVVGNVAGNRVSGVFGQRCETGGCDVVWWSTS